MTGPNGFLRTLAGRFGQGSANLAVATNYAENLQAYRGSLGIALEIRNHGAGAQTVKIVGAYSGKSVTHSAHPGGLFTYFSELQRTHGWYDFTITVESDANFRRQLAGHVETGKDSVSDPAIGAGTASAALFALAETLA